MPSRVPVRWQPAVPGSITVICAKGFDRGAQSHSDGLDFDTWRMAQAGFKCGWTLARDSVTVQGVG